MAQQQQLTREQQADVRTLVDVHGFDEATAWEIVALGAGVWDGCVVEAG